MSLDESELPEALTWRRTRASPKQQLAQWLENDVRDRHSNEDDDIWDDTGSVEMKIGHAVLAICLNLGTPQGLRTKTEEAFFDPSTRHHERSMRKIMANLIDSIEGVQKMNILALPDPRHETVINALHRARRECKDQQMLFLYNDHGALAATEQGEIWVYDVDYPATPSTYNPVFVSALLDAAGPGMVWIWDNDNAATVVECAITHGRRRDEEAETGYGHLPGKEKRRTHSTHDIHFGATAQNQALPISEGLPRDVFTCCIFSPLLMALRFHYLIDDLRQVKSMASATPPLDMKDLLNIPGDLNERETPLGELNWILMAILETIAFQSLPLSTFRRLFRSNAALASLSRGFILASRVLRHYDCTPISYPVISATHQHPLWSLWDSALDDYLWQFPLKEPLPGDPYIYRQPKIISEMLCAFAAQMTLFSHDTTTKRSRIAQLCANPMPVVFFAAAGGQYRHMAIILLARYLDLGGIHPVRWAFACGVDQLRPRLLHWENENETIAVVFIFQRLMMHPDGPGLLLQYNPSTGVNTISILTSLLNRHLLDPSNPLPADTMAGILYMMSIACKMPGLSPLTLKDEKWSRIIVTSMQHQDPLVRQWSLLTFGTAWTCGNNRDVNAVDEALTLVEKCYIDDSEQVRMAAVYAIWNCHHTHAYSRASSEIQKLVQRSSARLFSNAFRDAAINVRRASLACIAQLFESRPSWLFLAPLCYIGIKGKNADHTALREECEVFLQACIHCCDLCNHPDIARERYPLLDAACTALVGLCSDPDNRLQDCARQVLTRAIIEATHSTIVGHLPALKDCLTSLSSCVGAGSMSEVDAYVKGMYGYAPNRSEEDMGAPASQYPLLLGAVREVIHDLPPAPSNKACSDERVFGFHDLASTIKDWRARAEGYFHTPRLIWEEVKPIADNTAIKEKVRLGKSLALESENHADRPWSYEQSHIIHSRQIRSLHFHAYADLLSVSDATSATVYDLAATRPKAILSVPERWGSLASTRFVNERRDEGTVLQVTSRGVVRVVQGVLSGEGQQKTSMVFRACKRPQAEIVSVWNPARLELLVSAKPHSIAVWNVHDARKTWKWMSASHGAISCLDVEQERGLLTLAGTQRGSLELYDQRQKSRGPVSVWQDPEAVFMRSCNITAGQEIVSLSADGSLKLWDLRVTTAPIAANAPSADFGPKKTLAAACMESVTLISHLSALSPSIEPELAVYRLAFPSPVPTSILSLPMPLNPGDNAALAFHPHQLRLAASVGHEISIRTSQ